MVEPAGSSCFGCRISPLNKTTKTVANSTSTSIVLPGLTLSPPPTLCACSGAFYDIRFESILGIDIACNVSNRNGGEASGASATNRAPTAPATSIGGFDFSQLLSGMGSIPARPVTSRCAHSFLFVLLCIVKVLTIICVLVPLLQLFPPRIIIMR